ncbi:hypothetical protein ZYGR_0R00420 [Zygosaccharomyces rouxii]|uniref:ZYRO0F01012p n=2 Tax=Zygosaccharomyces rouxii TaxID=4956 RepID=C5DWZ7_ZYGRC|nr:uncharacterized protein ZYRO0F01012g [Zygosaccharomyces rouxii]KAH9199073.1 hypothetical protein LQ764DRAFT_210232 [Zygosaccharomyces rouxii]GAV49801.1 hypothetical protein ZYGR_0R00420 [Zygosaccharomyces rouxii]CAR28308.1 ZYRO0F01012p [Zygosaccharomyces rouxii]
MSGLFQDYDSNAAATAAANIPDVLPKEFLAEDLITDSRNDTATSLSLDLSKEGGFSSAGDSISNSASAKHDQGNQQNLVGTSPLEALETTKLPLSTPMSMIENTNTNSNAGNGSGIDPNLLNNNLFMDSLGLSPPTEELSGPDPYSQPSLNSLLDDYVSTEMLLNNNNQGPIQDTVTSPVPDVTGSRGSISHSVDFWNLPNNPKTRRRTTGFTGIDSELSDVLNGYHLNLRRNSLSNNVGGAPPPSQRHGFKKQPQRSSMSVLDGPLNTDLFNKIYENGVSSSNLKLVSPWEKNTNGDDDQGLPSNLEPMMSPKSPKNVIGTGTGSGTGGKRRPATSNQNFINPSMVLSDNASTSAKVATTGGGNSEGSFDLSLDPQAIMRESPGPNQVEGGIPSPLVLPQELSSPSPKEQEATTLGQQDPLPLGQQEPLPLGQQEPLPLGVPETPLPLTVPQQSQAQAQAQHEIQSPPRPLAAPAAARRRMSTANIMTIHNGNGAVNVQNQPTVSSRKNSRSITPMNASDEDVKPFKCKECSKAFRRSEHLKRHIRSVHSSERPFACMFCEKKFSRSDNLSQHLKTHKKHGDF